MHLHDVWDLAALGKVNVDRGLLRMIAVLKMREAPLHRDPFSSGMFRGMIERRAAKELYDGDNFELMSLHENEELEIPVVV